MSRTARILLALGLALCAALAGGYFGMRSPRAPAASDATSSVLFAQTLPDATGAQHVLAQYRGKIMVVNFWATWCAPCVEEIPELSRLQSEFSARNVQFVGIGIDNVTNVAEFEKKIHATYPLLVAGANGSELVRLFGDTQGALPYTLVLDAAGSVRATKLGRIDATALRRWLAPLIGGQR